MPRRGENIYKRRDGRWEASVRFCDITIAILYAYRKGMQAPFAVCLTALDIWASVYNINANNSAPSAVCFFILPVADEMLLKNRQ